ncbi:MAG: hypothetical protein AAF637_08510 [Pseudomonadota bacterium]
MLVQIAKVRKYFPIVVAFLFTLVPAATIEPAKAQDQLLLEDLEDEKNLCVCGLRFYKGEIESVMAEITALRDADGEAAFYYELVREWTTLRMEADTLIEWCKVIPLELAPDVEPLTCPSESHE